MWYQGASGPQTLLGSQCLPDFVPTGATPPCREDSSLVTGRQAGRAVRSGFSGLSAAVAVYTESL